MSHKHACLAGALLIGLSLPAAGAAWASGSPDPAPAPSAASQAAQETPTPPTRLEPTKAPETAAEPEATLATFEGRGDPLVNVAGNNNTTNLTNNSTSTSTVTNNTVNSLSNQDLTAVNSGNTITAGVVGSGAITLDGAALSGFAGVGNFLMNTGHNNNLQSNMNVTVIIGP